MLKIRNHLAIKDFCETHPPTTGRYRVPIGTGTGCRVGPPCSRAAGLTMEGMKCMKYFKPRGVVLSLSFTI